MSCRNPSKIAKDFWIRLAIFLLYIFIGALIFMAVENRPYNDFEENLKGIQMQVHTDLSSLRNNTKTCVSNMTDDEMEFFAEKVRNITKVLTKRPTKWDWDRGMRLCFEIMSTIGYGSTPPKTQAGRMIAVFYTLFGIPIFLFFLKSVGEVINRQIIKAINFIEKKFLNIQEPENVELKVLIGFTFLLVLDVFLEAVVLRIVHDFTFIDALYTVIITATTVGFGDIMLTNEMTMIVSLVLLSTVLDGASCYAAKKIEKQRNKQNCTCFGRRSKRNVTENQLESYGNENKAIDHSGKEDGQGKNKVEDIS